HHARYYDPATGRWTTTDPSGFGAGDPNLYRYVENSPTLDVDPLGLKGGANGRKRHTHQENIKIVEDYIQYAKNLLRWLEETRNSLDKETYEKYKRDAEALIKWWTILKSAPNLKDEDLDYLEKEWLKQSDGAGYV